LHTQPYTRQLKIPRQAKGSSLFTDYRSFAPLYVLLNQLSRLGIHHV
jgi:hypothetical protein